MGSFNTTCFASGQTIAPGDACYVLPIKQAASYNAMQIFREETQLEVSGVAHMTCYPHCFWETAGGFLSGTYNDYGNVVLDNTRANNLRLLDFAGTLLNDTYTVKQGSNSHHDLAVDFKAFMVANTPEVYKTLQEEGAGLSADQLHGELIVLWEHYQELSHSYRIFVSDHKVNKERPRQLLHAVIHKVSLDKLVAMIGGKERQKEFFDSAMASIKKYREALYEPVVVDLAAYVFTQGLGRVGCREGNYFSDEAAAVKSLLERFGRKEFDEETFFIKLQPWLDARFVLEALDILNVKLSPMVYASQDYSNEIGRDYLEFVAEVSAEVTAARKARYAHYDYDKDDDASASESSSDELQALQALLKVAESCEPGILTPEYIQEFIRQRQAGASIEQAAEATHEFIGVV